METMDPTQVEQMKNQAARETKMILDQLENDFPGITEGVATVIGSVTGGAGSLAALYFLGTTGLSAVGITSGLATAGAIVGGGMVSGLFILAAPVAICGILGYAFAKKRKNAKIAVALGVAIKKLYEVQERLLRNAEYFKNEIAEIKAVIDFLTKKQPA